MGFRPYLELLLPPPENGVVGDSVTTAGTKMPSKVTKISLREVRPTDVSPGCSQYHSIPSHYTLIYPVCHCCRRMWWRSRLT